MAEALVQRKLEFHIRKQRRSRKDSSTKEKERLSKRTESASRTQDCNFTPEKNKRRGVSVSATRASVGYLSPVKNISDNDLGSPVRHILSPKRHTNNNALVLDENLCSPQKQKRTVSILSSPLRPCLSPIKRNILNSPQKSLSTNSFKPTAQPEFALKSPREILAKKRPEANQNYHRTKQLLHTAQPEKVICRDTEQSTINTFLIKHITARTGGSFYISGAPGTGKTAVLTEMIKLLKSNSSHGKVVYLNCMGVRDVMDIYHKIYSEITGKAYPGKSGLKREVLKTLERLIQKSEVSIVLVLDEIDQLDSKCHEVLYTLFEWPALPKSSLILIGVANSLDLTDRILPRLQAQLELKPTLMNFAPYTTDQIVKVIEDRLKELKEGGVCMIESSAIQFCARKVAAMAGDMRRALDVCRRAIEQMETEIRLQGVLKPSDCNSPTKKNLSLKRIGIPQISKVVNEVYGSRVVSSTQESDSIPIQQKIAVCSLLLMLKKGKGTKEVELGNLLDVFKKVCKQCNVAAVGQSEFIGICNLLDSQGIIGVKRSKELRRMKVNLRLDEQDLEHALQDKTLMANIMKRGLP